MPQSLAKLALQFAIMPIQKCPLRGAISKSSLKEKEVRVWPGRPECGQLVYKLAAKEACHLLDQFIPFPHRMSLRCCQQEIHHSTLTTSSSRNLQANDFAGHEIAKANDSGSLLVILLTNTTWPSDQASTPNGIILT